MVEPVTINVRFLARDLDLPQEQVQAVVSLLDDGHPVPFIARYRKDITGSMSEENLRIVEEELQTQRMLCERKQAILKMIDALGKVTPDLDKKIRDARSAKRLEDLYLPYKLKKKTSASTARERGLEPLAEEILSGTLLPEKLDARASEFINEDKKIRSIADALLGAGYIIAELYSEKIELLQNARDFIHRNGKLSTTKIEQKTEEVGREKGVSKSEFPPTAPPVPNAETAPATDDKAKHPEVARSTAPLPARVEILFSGESQSQPVTESPEGPEAKTESEPNTVAAEAEIGENTATTETEKTESRTAAAEAAIPDTASDTVPESVSDSASDTVPEVISPAPEVIAETSEASEAAPASETIVQDDVQAVTESFQQWKAAQVEQGIPVVKSQNNLRKKKKEEVKKKKAEAKVRQQAHYERQYSDYFNFNSGVRNIPAHRILAVNRGERAKVLRVQLQCDEERILKGNTEQLIPADHPLKDFLTGCLKDSLHRLVLPTLERELRTEMTEYAEKHSIRVFGNNLRTLLLQPPLHRKRVLALDPSTKHGCKMVALDEFGNILGFETVYLAGSVDRKSRAIKKMADLVDRYRISVVAIANGAGHRAAEECISKMIATRFAETDLAYILVNGAGTSAYSVSSTAQEEFPDYDALQRGAISIGRRLQDPLTELVKIDPASLGDGTYRHDVKSKLVRSELGTVIESSVNYVGVDLNTATPAILKYVCGLNPLTAKRIFEYRKTHGPFRSREALKSVPGLGETVFMHAAGFFKVRNGANPFDATWIHPESYDVATKILEKLGFTVDDLRCPERTKELTTKIREGKIGELVTKFSEELGAGSLTVRDILNYFTRPDRDPRDSFQQPIFRKKILRMEDLQSGMELTGTVLTIVDFGAFIDIGLHDSGLVHISQMGDRYVQDAHERLSVGDLVRVWVVEVDLKRKRISLSMLPPGVERQPRSDSREDSRKRDDGPRQERPARRDGASQGNAPRSDARGDTSRSEPRPQGDRPPRKEGEGRPGGDRPAGRDGRGQRDRNDRGRDRDRDRNDRGPKTYVAPPKEKMIKPITDEMKKGKEPMRSFGDLAQLLGRVNVVDPTEEKKRKKEDERKRKEREKAKEPVTNAAPVVTDTPASESDGTAPI